MSGNAAAIREENFFLIAQDGVNLAGSAWSAHKPTGILLWLHGFAEHRRRYGHFASFMASNNWTVASIDFRGHGESDGKRGFIRSFEEYLLDVRVFVQWARKNYPGEKLVLGAHSNGGLIAARYLQEYAVESEQFRALALTGPFFDVAAPVPAWKKALANRLAAVLPGLSVPSGIKPEWVSHDPEIVENYRNDPLIFTNATARWFTETVRNQQSALLRAHEIKLPAVVMQGLEDRIVSVAAAEQFYNDLGAKKKRWFGYEGFYHEILNEVGREQVYSDLLGWLKKNA